MPQHSACWQRAGETGLLRAALCCGVGGVATREHPGVGEEQIPPSPPGY